MKSRTLDKMKRQYTQAKRQRLTARQMRGGGTPHLFMLLFNNDRFKYV